MSQLARIVRIEPAHAEQCGHVTAAILFGVPYSQCSCKEPARIVTIREGALREALCTTHGAAELAWHALVATGNIPWAFPDSSIQDDENAIAAIFRSWIERCFPVPQLTTDLKP